MRILPYLWLTLMGVSGQSLAQTVNQTDAQGRKQGAWQKLQENGTVRYEGQFKNNVPTGVFKYYYPDGKLEATNNHVGDGITAAAHMYWPSGTIKAKGIYRNMKKDSLWQYFNDAQVLILEENYKAEQLSGLQRSYYPETGKMVEETNYVDGKKQGPSTRWYDNGKLWSKGNYVDNELNGDFEMNFYDGKPMLRGKYAKGMRVSTWLEFNDDSSIRTQTVHKDNGDTVVKRENGTFEDTWPSGMPRIKVTYLKGKLNGPFTEWHNKGEFKLTTRPAKEGAEPEQMEEMVGQTLKRKGEYNQGQLHGPIEVYDESGKLLRTENYDNGKLLH